MVERPTRAASLDLAHQKTRIKPHPATRPSHQRADPWAWHSSRRPGHHLREPLALGDLADRRPGWVRVAADRQQQLVFGGGKPGRLGVLL
ncbi:MAG: hypothetical protein ACRDPA_22935 [Solirubrobacteraceae bacterium]